MTDWLLTTKPAFLNECLALQPKEFMQVQKKLVLLTEDPAADGKTRKQLKNWEGRLHRLRSGDLRVFYTFEAPYISVLALRRRSEDTYDEDLEAEFLGGPGGQPHDAAKAPDPAAAGDAWKRWLEPSAASKQGLSRSIDKALLDGLKVPKVHHAALLKVTTEDALLDCPVPQDVLTRVLDAVCGRPIDQVLGQPDLVVSAPDDLLRFREGGELLGFLLRLNAEQEKFVAWGVRSSGPTLLKGGPGTGKSTVALYRLREMLKELRKARAKAGDATPPRVLFTTYTRALTRVSEQLLRSLLGADADLVDVRTTDTILRQIATEGTAYSPSLATADDERSAPPEGRRDGEVRGQQPEGRRAEADHRAHRPRVPAGGDPRRDRRPAAREPRGVPRGPATGPRPGPHAEPAGGRLAGPAGVPRCPRRAGADDLGAAPRAGRGADRAGRGRTAVRRRARRRGAGPPAGRPPGAGLALQDAGGPLPHRGCEPVDLRRQLPLAGRTRLAEVSGAHRGPARQPPLDAGDRRGGRGVPRRRRRGARASTRRPSSGSTCTAGPSRPCAPWRTTSTR